MKYKSKARRGGAWHVVAILSVAFVAVMILHQVRDALRSSFPGSGHVSSSTTYSVEIFRNDTGGERGPTIVENKAASSVRPGLFQSYQLLNSVQSSVTSGKRVPSFRMRGPIRQWGPEATEGNVIKGSVAQGAVVQVHKSTGPLLSWSTEGTLISNSSHAEPGTKARAFPKVALMFLSQTEIYNELVWRIFFERAGQLTMKQDPPYHHVEVKDPAVIVGGQMHPPVKKWREEDYPHYKLQHGIMKGPENSHEEHPQEDATKNTFEDFAQWELPLMEQEYERVSHPDSSFDGRTVLQAQKFFNVYVHCSPNYTFPSTSIFAGREVPDRIDTTRGYSTYLLNEPMLVLLRNALNDLDNHYLVMVSDSSIPIYPPEVVYAELLSDARSRINACPRDDTDIDRRWQEDLETRHLKRRHWRKSFQWFGMTRHHAAVVLADQHTSELFKRYCYSDVKKECVPDEHVIPTILATYGLDQQTDCEGSLHFMLWPGGWHPRTYRAHHLSTKLALFMRWNRADCPMEDAMESARGLYNRTLPSYAEPMSFWMDEGDPSGRTKSRGVRQDLGGIEENLGRTTRQTEEKGESGVNWENMKNVKGHGAMTSGGRLYEHVKDAPRKSSSGGERENDEGGGQEAIDGEVVRERVGLDGVGGQRMKRRLLLSAVKQWSSLWDSKGHWNESSLEDLVAPGPLQGMGDTNSLLEAGISSTVRELLEDGGQDMKSDKESGESGNGANRGGDGKDGQWDGSGIDEKSDHQDQGRQEEEKGSSDQDKHEETSDLEQEGIKGEGEGLVGKGQDVEADEVLLDLYEDDDNDERGLDDWIQDQGYKRLGSRCPLFGRKFRKETLHGTFSMALSCEGLGLGYWCSL